MHLAVDTPKDGGSRKAKAQWLPLRARHQKVSAPNGVDF
jgi:hypothetical protein